MVISNVFDKAFNASTIAILCEMCLKLSSCTSCDILSSVRHICHYLLDRQFKANIVDIKLCCEIYMANPKVK